MSHSSKIHNRVSALAEVIDDDSYAGVRSVTCLGPDFKLEELAQYFHLPIAQAAKEIGVCATVLKKICRKNKVPRWPHRKIKSLNKAIESLERSVGQNPEQSVAVTAQIADFRFRKDAIMKNPEIVVTGNFGAHFATVSSPEPSPSVSPSSPPIPTMQTNMKRKRQASQRQISYLHLHESGGPPVVLPRSTSTTVIRSPFTHAQQSNRHSKRQRAPTRRPKAEPRNLSAALSHTINESPNSMVSTDHSSSPLDRHTKSHSNSISTDTSTSIQTVGSVSKQSTSMEITLSENLPVGDENHLFGTGSQYGEVESRHIRSDRFSISQLFPSTPSSSPMEELTHEPLMHFYGNHIMMNTPHEMDMLMGLGMDSGAPTFGLTRSRTNSLLISPSSTTSSASTNPPSAPSSTSSSATTTPRSNAHQYAPSPPHHPGYISVGTHQSHTTSPYGVSLTLEHYHPRSSPPSATHPYSHHPVLSNSTNASFIAYGSTPLSHHHPHSRYDPSLAPSQQRNGSQTYYPSGSHHPFVDFSSNQSPWF